MHAAGYVHVAQPLGISLIMYLLVLLPRREMIVRRRLRMKTPTLVYYSPTIHPSIHPSTTSAISHRPNINFVVSRSSYCSTTDQEIHCCREKMPASVKTLTKPGLGKDRVYGADVERRDDESKSKPKSPPKYPPPKAPATGNDPRCDRSRNDADH